MYAGPLFPHESFSARVSVSIARTTFMCISEKPTRASYIPILISVAEYPLFCREREIFRN